jgi:hypothetical protein
MSFHTFGDCDDREKDGEEGVAWDQMECVVRIEVVLRIWAKLLRVYTYK